MTNVRLQNLRDFTVQIRNAEDQIVGTGIAVSTDGKIVTCAHVVQAAGVDPRNSNGAEVGVYFPQARGGEEKNRKAVIEKFFPKHDDDVVLLQLTSGASPLAPEQIAVIGSTGEILNREFDSFGYRSFGEHSLGKSIAGAPAHGKILGTVELLDESKFHKEPLMLESNQLNDGMSGAGVLDVEDNLVVGIVSHVYDPDETGRDQDTAFGVDARVLPLPPFDLPFRTQPLPKRPAPEPKFDIIQAEAAVFIKEKYSWNSAPAVLTEWIGRDDLLKQITEDWNNPQKHVTGLIGFGGEGKSSLARKWVETLERSTFDGLFWWGFYENRSVDEFLEAALKYMSGGRIDPRAVPSSNLRAQIIGAMLGTGRYLFVLDGLEVMQHQEGDQYGLLQSNDLRDLLTFFARPDNQSFCLITSRAPLLDLMDYTTYTHRDVDRLSEDDGRALLQRLGIKGNDSELNKVVEDWDGHALTLSILAAYLAERFEGDIHHLADIPIPTADEPRYERVHRVLRRYDEHLIEEEREFLKLFSVFRLPVQESAFEKVFQPLLKNVGARHVVPLPHIVNRLANYRLIRHDEQEKSFTTHPLIRNHYFALFTKGDPSQEKATHAQIKDYYLSIAGEMPQFPTLDDLKPLIEVVHHACQAGAYDEALQVYEEKISQQNRFVILNQLGAYDTVLLVMMEFLPKDANNFEPLVNLTIKKGVICATAGLCLRNLGRMSEGIKFNQASIDFAVAVQDWNNASRGYQNLADLHAQFGALDASAEAALQALDLARKAENKDDEATSQSWLGTTTHLLGKTDEANLAFLEAERIRREAQPDIRYLYSFSGIRHADHLRRAGDLDYARRVTEANLQICERNHFTNRLSLCHRVAGDLAFDSNNYEKATFHYNQALKIARGISHLIALIEALLARGRFFAKHPSTGSTQAQDANAAFSDLNEALGYCVESGYRICEADVRVALGWAYLANGEKEKANQSAERALQMSNEMGYHWGKVDAEEVLKNV